MDTNNWRAAQAQISIPGQSMNSEGLAGPGMEAADWRTQLQAESRQRIVNKIMETLKRHLPFSGHEGLQELHKIALRFEEKIYTAASSQSDYLRRISLKMLTMENKSPNHMVNSLQSSNAINNINPQDSASQTIQSQMQNQGQPLPLPMVANQSQVLQPLLSQNIQNNLTSAGAPNSGSFASALPGGGMPQGTMSKVSGQNPNMQTIPNMSTVTPSAIGNSMAQGLPSNIYTNSQRQMGRQQQVMQLEQQQQQQSQNSSQYPYNQQLQQHLINQKFQPGPIPQSLLQSQIQQQQQQQQNISQANQLQSSQQTVMQPSLRQSSVSSTVQQNQQTAQSIIQQQPQSVLQQQQPSILHQQQTSLPQHSLLPTQQQQLSGHQTNVSSIQQNSLIDQQSNALDAQQQHQQQQRLITQQNNISNLQQQQTINHRNNVSNMHQQLSTGQQNNLQTVHQLGSQTNISGFQQQQMVGIQNSSSNLQSNQQSVHALQQAKVSAQLQIQQNMENLLPNQGQQQLPRLQQQQLMSQIQSQPGQLQQHLGLQQPANPLQSNMQQRIQTSGPLLQPHTDADQQKQLLQSQRVIPEVPLDSSSLAVNSNSGDWQEEIYQKIKTMNEKYFSELNEMYQKMAAKLHQHDSLPQQPKNEQLEKVRFYKIMLERFLMFLRTNKNEVNHSHREKIAPVEKQIVNVLNSNRPRKPISSLQQGQLPQPQIHTMQQSQQPQPQMSQINTLENQLNSQMQPGSGQSSLSSAQHNNLNSYHHNSLSSVSSVSNARQKMMDPLQLVSNVESQGNPLNSMQQLAMGSMQQNPVSGQQQMNMNSVSSQSGSTSLQSNVNSLQPNALQVKPEQQMLTQQLKQQYQQRQMQHLMQKHQLIHQQQQQQTAQQTSAQLTSQQMIQLNQISDPNDIKMRQQINSKAGVLQHHNSSQRPSYHNSQMKSGTPFSISSPQVLSVASPQVGHHSSPQLDQQNMATSHIKAGTPLQSVNSPFIVPSPSTSMAPSPMPGDSDKFNPGVTSVASAGNNVHHSTGGASGPTQSLAIGTPGISPSPFLAEFTSPDGATSINVSGNINVVEQPLERLMKVVKSMSPKALDAAVSDISSVVSMVDRIAGSAPGNGSRAAVGEDLVAMTKCCLQARNFLTRDGSSGTKKMRRYTSAMPSNVVSSTGSVSDGFNRINGGESDGESTGASGIKRPRIEVNHALEEELREINQRLLDTVVYISEEDVGPTAISAAAEGREGTIVKCSFTAIALSPNLKSQYASAQMSPIQPLRLLIPNNYPNCSPILLDKFPIEVSKEYEDLSKRAKSRFSISLRTLAQPMSLGEIARTWDICARAVISEYAQQSGGGSFSSKYGVWENYLSAA